MHARMAVALFAIAALGTACGAGSESGVEISGERMVINGTPNEPVGDKVEAGRFESPEGDFVVLIFDSQAGPCYHLRHPDGRLEPGCLRGSGIDPDRPITGGPDTGSIRAINGAAFNYGLANPGAEVGMVHHGLAHPAVAEVRVERGDGEVLRFATVTASEVPGLHVFFAFAPADWDGYELAAYDAQGCKLQSQGMRPRLGPSEEPEDSRLTARDC